MQITLTKKSGKALYIQLYEAISGDIILGRLPNGMRLPSRRALAEQLHISQNTVEGAYKMLLDTGYIVSIPRQGYVVAFQSPAYNGNNPWELPPPEIVIFSPNGIDISRVNRSAYARLVREISYNDGFDIFSYADKNGEFALRNAISQYLYSFRNVKCSPDRIILGAGAEYLLTALAAVLPDSALIMENPCHTRFLRALAPYGNRVITLPYNLREFDFDALHASQGSLLFIDPDARFPRGRCMTVGERRQLLDWAAQKRDRYIIENCYDSELLWETGEALHSMDTDDKVIYMGSFSRSLCPAVKTSYMALPSELLELWKQKHVYYYALTSKLEQYTLAEFINKGYFTRHYKAMRKLYREKAGFLSSCLTDTLGDGLQILSNTASTYITALPSRDPEDIIALAHRRGLKLSSANSFNPLFKSHREQYLRDNYLVLGFGDLSYEKLRLGVRLLGDAFK